MRTRSVLSGALAAVVAAGLCVAPAAAAPTSDIVEIPISFQVTNTNTTSVACASDGKDYTVKGVVVGPRDVIETGDAATLFLHAVTWGDYYFNLDIPGHNFARSLAERGHVSIAVDRLGYGSSDKPAGMDTCFGSEADVAHQMVDDLKSGDYTLEGKKATSFEKVFISGSSVGGLISNIVGFTYGNVDGIFNQSWGDFSAGPYAGAELIDVAARCEQGGDAGAPPDYAQFALNSRERFYFNDAKPEVRDAVPDSHPDPCGQLLSLPFAIGESMQHLGKVGVPVLLMFGSGEIVFPTPPSMEQMAARYSGSPQVTKLLVPNASHYPLVEQGFPQIVDATDAWLTEHTAVG